jgi:hypothetical protein
MNNRISRRNKKKLLVTPIDYEEETKEDMIRGILEA